MIAIRHRNLSAVWLIMASLSLLLVAGSLLYLNKTVFATESATSRSGQHILTVYDDGEKKGILTEATTLKQALEEAGFNLSPNDITEPALDHELVASNYNVTIYRARPVLVIDGSTRTKIMSAYRTGHQIADQAGIKLQDEDIADLEYSTDIVADGALEKLVIKRATPLNLVLYGEKTVVYTQESTVGAMLAAKQIDLSDKDRVSRQLSAPIWRNMTIEIWREGKQTVTRKEAVKFTVRQISDANRPVGYKKVQTAGKNGQKLVTYEVTVKNGKEVKKKAIQTVVTKKPVEQVEIVGTKYQLPAGSHEDWMRAAGIDSSDFGYVNAIFQQESGWRPNAVNPSGLYVGLGQTSPATLSAACPNWQVDPICQIKFFDGYKNRYGSWKAAYEFKFGKPGQSGAGWW